MEAISFYTSSHLSKQLFLISKQIICLTESFENIWAAVDTQYYNQQFSKYSKCAEYTFEYESVFQILLSTFYCHSAIVVFKYT